MAAAVVVEIKTPVGGFVLNAVRFYRDRAMRCACTWRQLTMNMAQQYASSESCWHQLVLTSQEDATTVRVRRLRQFEHVDHDDQVVTKLIY